MIKNNDYQRRKNLNKPFWATFLVWAILMFIFFTPLISGFEFDNVKHYDKIEKEITIYNWNIIGKIFDIKLAEYTLTKNTDQCLINCYSEGTANLYKKGYLFSDLNFKNKKNSFVNIKNKILIEVTEEYEIDVNDYKKVCSETKNGTSCNNEISGTHKETKSKTYWKEYNNQVLDKGNYKWRIEGTKKPKKDIDWIGSAFGEDFTEWAWWNSDWEKKKEVTFNGTINENWTQEIIFDKPASMNSDCSDIRWLNSAEDTELGHRNIICNTTTVIEHVRLDNNNSIYLYYNNSDASNTDNWRATYLCGDDFNDYTGVPTNITGGGSDTLSVAGSELNFSSSDSTIQWYCSNLINYQNYTAYHRGKSPENGYGIWTRGNSGVGNAEFDRNANSGNIHFYAGSSFPGRGTDYANTDTAFASSVNTYYNQTVMVNGTSHTTFIDGVNRFSQVLTQLTATSSYTGIRASMTAGNIITTDWYYVMPMQSNMPTYNIGAEMNSNELETTLNSPIDYFNSSSQSITFNCSATDETEVLNLTLIIDDEDNYTIYNTTANQNLSLEIGKTLSDGNHNWTCRASDGTGDLIDPNTATARDLTIDSTPPNVNVTYPYEDIDYHIGSTNLTINWSVSDTNLESCWWSMNGVSNTSVTCLDNNISINITSTNQNNFTLWANDSIGNENSSTRTWDYKIFENSQTYNSPTTSGTIEQFSMNITYNNLVFTNIQSTLVYNNTRYTGTNYGDGGEAIFNRTLTVPTVSASTNISFYWEVGLNNGTWNYYNLTEQNQTVNPFSIDDCTLHSIVLYNFTIKDEKTQTKLGATTQNTTANLDLNIYSLNRLILISNLSQNFTKKNSFAICINSSLTASEKYSSDLQLQYYADGYSKEYYHIQNATIDSTHLHNNISLYDLDNVTTQKFIITYKDDNLLPVSDALVQIQRKYINEGLFKTVEIPKTDFNGETLASLELNDAIYTIIVTKNGETLATFNEMEAVCQNPLISSCKIGLNSFSTSIEPTDFTSLDDFSFTLTYDEDLRRVQSIFIVPSGSSSTIILNATKFDSLGTTQVCSDTLTSSSGTLTCDIPSSFGNGSAIISLVKDNSLISKSVLSLEQNPEDIYGVGLIFLSLLLFLTLIGLGIGDNPIIMGFFLILGLVLAISLNLINTGTSSFIGAGATFLWLVVAIIIIIIKGANRQ